MSAQAFRTIIAGVEYEYIPEPTDGVSLSTGEAWWGTYVRYRALGSRKWLRFSVADVHSWDREAIGAALDYRVTHDSRVAR